MTTKRIFPIKNDPACLLKWAWSSVQLHAGTTNSCHRTRHYAIDPNNFDQFHNLPDKILARERMLEGQWPGFGCEYCKRVEDAGGTSDRQFQLAAQQDPNLTPPELKTNPRATHVTPTILEVYFNNTCNMACTYCGPKYSSLWEAENLKHGNLFSDDAEFSVRLPAKNPDYDKMVESLWTYLKTDSRYLILRRYHILGGEPFLMKELDDSLDFWDQHGNPDLIFSIITNLNIPHKIFLRYVDRFEQLVSSNKVWKFQITGSLDCWGPEQEYVRYGLDLNLWRQNFEYLIDKPWATLGINSVISALTIKKLPELMLKINEWNQARSKLEPIDFSFNYTNREDGPAIFGPGVFDIELDQALQFLKVDSAHTRGVHQSLMGIKKLVSSSTRNVEKINKLKNYLSQLDQRRGTDWKKTFPWLNQDF